MAGNQEEAPQKSSKMKLIIILVLGLVLVGGGGFAAYLFLFKKEPPPSAETAAHSPHAPVVAEPVMFQMDAFLVNLADPGGKRYLKVTVQLSLDNLAAQNELQNRMVVVRDGVIMLLSGKTYEDISSPAGKMALKREVMARINKALTQGQVKEIYFTEFLVQ